MIPRRTFLLLALAACARGPQFRDYDGPEVTEVRQVAV